MGWSESGAGLAAEQGLVSVAGNVGRISTWISAGERWPDQRLDQRRGTLAGSAPGSAPGNIGRISDWISAGTSDRVNAADRVGLFWGRSGKIFSFRLINTDH